VALSDLPGLVNCYITDGKIIIFNGKTMGKPWENGDLYGKSSFLMGKSTISMAIFNSNLLTLPEGI
jgi:hypothetical protein